MGTSKETSRALPHSKYKGISIDKLVLYAVNSVVAGGETCTQERLVKECFELFPKGFSLVAYPQWPDSARVNKAWLRCRTDKAWIEGNAKRGFTLTEAGRMVLRETQTTLHLGHTTKQGATRTYYRRTGATKFRTKEELLLFSTIRKSELYKTYVTDCERFTPSPLAVREMLGLSWSASEKRVKQRLKNAIHVAEAFEEAEVVQLLKACLTPNRRKIDA